MSPEVLKALSLADKKLARHIKQHGAIDKRLRNMRSPFEALVDAIIHQQISTKAAATIFARLKALYPKEKFPSPQSILETSDEKLGSIGLFRAKVGALKDLASKAESGELPNARALGKMSDEEIVTQLTSIRGIGQWTVEMLLIFRLDRPDVLPASDLGVRRGFSLLHKMTEMPTAKELLSHGEAWRPYRTTAAHFLWHICNQNPPPARVRKAIDNR